MSAPKFDQACIQTNGFWMGTGSEQVAVVQYGPREVPLSDELISELKSAENNPSGSDIPKESAEMLVKHVYEWWNALPDKDKAELDAEINPPPAKYPE